MSDLLLLLLLSGLFAAIGVFWTRDEPSLPWRVVLAGLLAGSLALPVLAVLLAIIAIGL